MLSRDHCTVPLISGEKGGCRPRIIVKSAQDPGLFLEGTTKEFAEGKLASTMKLETLTLSKAALSQSLFKIPTGYSDSSMNLSADLTAGRYGDRCLDISGDFLVGSKKYHLPGGETVNWEWELARCKP